MLHQGDTVKATHRIGNSWAGYAQPGDHGTVSEVAADGSVTVQFGAINRVYIDDLDAPEDVIKC